jgi:hypothetical protein
LTGLLRWGCSSLGFSFLNIMKSRVLRCLQVLAKFRCQPLVRCQTFSLSLSLLLRTQLMSFINRAVGWFSLVRQNLQSYDHVMSLHVQVTDLGLLPLMGVLCWR